MREKKKGGTGRRTTRRRGGFAPLDRFLLGRKGGGSEASVFAFPMVTGGGRGNSTTRSVRADYGYQEKKKEGLDKKTENVSGHYGTWQGKRLLPSRCRVSKRKKKKMHRRSPIQPPHTYDDARSRIWPPRKRRERGETRWRRLRLMLQGGKGNFASRDVPAHRRKESGLARPGTQIGGGESQPSYHIVGKEEKKARRDPLTRHKQKWPTNDRSGKKKKNVGIPSGGKGWAHN